MNGPPALVLGRLGLLRCLGRVGITVDVARELPNELEAHSRYCRFAFTVPNLRREPEAAMDRLIARAREIGERPVVFLSAEADVLLFSRYRERLAPYFEIVLAAPELIEDLSDKARFGALAARLGLPVPETHEIRSEADARHAARQVGYPCILKPTMQLYWYQSPFTTPTGPRKAIRIEDEEALERVLSMLPLDRGEQIIQQLIPGGDSAHFELQAYNDRTGALRAAVAIQKLRTFPIHFGAGTYARFVHEPELEHLGADALAKLGYVGASDLDFKRDARTGRFYLLEINPRFSISTILPERCGVNLPLLQYLDAIGRPLPTLRAAGGPRRWAWPEKDWSALADYRRAHELSLGAWMRSYTLDSGPLELHGFAWDDPWPSVVGTSRRLLRASWGVLRRAGRAFAGECATRGV